MSVFGLRCIDDAPDRLSILVTLLLSMIAFQYIVAETIPPVPYLTFADEYVMTSYLFVFSVIVYVVILAKYQPNNEATTSFDSNMAKLLFLVWCGIQVVFCAYARLCLAQGEKTLNMSYSELSDANALTNYVDNISVTAENVRIMYKTPDVNGDGGEK